MRSEMTILIARKVTFSALVWLFPLVNERMSLQMATLVERFVAPLTNIFFNSGVGSLVISKARPACECLWTQVTRYLFGHFQLTAPVGLDSLQSLNKVAKTQFTAADYFPFHNNLNYPKFCIGFKIRKSRSEQLLLSGSGHSK